MIIPFGYGQARFKFEFKSGQFVSTNFVNLEIDSSTSFVEDIEVARTYETINHNIRKFILGYRFRFKIRLRDGSSSQSNLCNFLYYYNQLQNEGKVFNFMPHYSAGMPDWSIEKASYNVILRSKKLTNLTNGIICGQLLDLDLETIDFVDVDDYNYIFCRETNQGAWSIKPEDSGVHVQPVDPKIIIV